MQRTMTFLAVAALTACGGSNATMGPAEDAAGDSAASEGGPSDGAAGDGAASDGGGGMDGAGPDGAEATANTCTADGGFATFVTGCTNTQSCIVKLHQVDCCGTKDAIGVNHDQYTVFDQAEAAWEAQCPACGCAPGPTTAQDGKTGSSGSVKVECTDFDGGAGVCKTYFQ